ncbi:hypothetical protein DKT68_09765 [Micromonospora acroterricola]|uniref:Uncharacterized protein n=1 Tax=Micromonospora acroterricola TaxID=2202421 RepID=A0A317D5N4_9ACTN|nr:hypothetical protein [Micromonospora acroterricola]PWR10158.1 hypothetical protein DKT68_09765 [Micromonospora acroterricola]
MWWSGVGILAIVFPAATVAAGYQIGGYPGVPCGFFVAGIATWFVGRRINRTEDRMIYHNEHRLYSIPMQYWAFLWMFLALTQTVLGLLGKAGWQQE